MLISFSSQAQEANKPKDDKVKKEEMKMEKEEAKMEKKDMNHSYAAGYSSSFEIGNSAYANKIVDIWKDWDDNMLDRHDYMADSLVMELSNGMKIKGKQANLEGAKQHRGSMKAVKTTIHAFVPLRVKDKNEDVVCIWGEEENTMADGKIEKKPIHEVWWFNKDGKIYYMRQWEVNMAKN